MDPTLKIAVVAAGSAILGGLIIGVVAPHIAWGIKKSENKREARKGIIHGAETMIIDYRQSALAGGKLTLGVSLRSNKNWMRLKPYLTPEGLILVQNVESQSVASDDVERAWAILEDELARLRKKWRLV